MILVAGGGGNSGWATFDPKSATPTATAEKIDWVRQAAGERFEEIELNVYPSSYPITVTDDTKGELRKCQDRIREHYAAADVFCLPSWWEAMPLTVLEAQAAGLPVVATAVGDVPSMITDGVDQRALPQASMLA